MKFSHRALHGALQFPCGTGSLVLLRDLQFMAPSNDIFHDAVALRERLDKHGYLYFCNCISPSSLRDCTDTVQEQLRSIGFLKQKEVQRASERSSSESNEARFEAVASSTKVVSVLSRIFGGSLQRFPYVSLDASVRGESHGFHMDSVFMSKGTPLYLSVWTPLTDMSLRHGPPVFVKGSNSHVNTEKLRFSYGKYDAYLKVVEGNGMYSYDPDEVKDLGEGLVTASFCAGDIVLFGGYSMHSYLTNQTDSVRLAIETKWCLKVDDIGPDPRYAGHDIANNTRFPDPKHRLTLKQAKETIWER